MRFVLFSAQYLPTVGGVERYTASLAGALAGLGHAVAVVTSALPGLPEKERQPDGVEVWRLPARQLMKGRFPAVRKNRAFRHMAGALGRQRFNFALINTRFYPLSVWAAAWCRRQGIPAVVLEHGTKHLSLDNALLNAAGNWYEHLAMGRVRRSCERFYGVSRASADWLQHFGVAAEGVLYNAVDADALDAIAAAPPVRFRTLLGMDGTAPLITFVGRLIREKGVCELLEAFGAVRAERPDARLVMAGEGPLYAGLAQAPPPGVHLAGTLPYKQSVALLAQGDVFCLPTYSEGFSSTVLEAAAVGACILTTRTGGSPELIENGVSGILLDDYAPATIAAALQRALGDAGFRRSAGSAVQAAVRARFTWPATAAALVAIAQKSGTTKDT